VVDPGAAIARGEHAERQADRHHHDARHDDQFQRRGQELEDIGHHGPVGIERDAEIAAEEVAEEIGILGEEIVVEMQPVTERRHGVGRGIGAERDASRIAGNDPGDGEDQQGYADQHDQRCSEPLREKADKRRHLWVFLRFYVRLWRRITPHQVHPTDRLRLSGMNYPLPQGER
jgi:hypothetical protein